MDMQLSERGLALIAFYEASVSLQLVDGSTPYPGGYDRVPKKYLTVYLDELATKPVPTVGLGTTTYDVEGLEVGTEFSQRDVLEMFRATIGRYEEAVTDLVHVPLNQNEFDALVSFAYNVGTGALAKSTLLKQLNVGNRALAAAEFKRWTKANGVDLSGLIKRRQAEMELFLRKPAKPRENISDSRTMRAAGALTVVGTATALAPAIGPLEQFAVFVENHVWVAALLAAGVGAYLVAVRWDDWRKGKR